MTRIRKGLAVSTLAVSSIASMGLASASYASAASTNTYLHVPTAFSSKAACTSDANAFVAKVKSVGGTFVPGGVLNSLMKANSTGPVDCLPSDQGWVHSGDYYGPKPAVSSDISIPAAPANYGADTPANRLNAVGFGDSSASETVRAAFSKYTITDFIHSYAFATRADCLSHYKSVDATLKANANVAIKNDTSPDYKTALNECDKGADSDGGSNQYGYMIEYFQNKNIASPFGYENTETENLYMENSKNTLTMIVGNTDAAGKWHLLQKIVDPVG